MIPKNGQAYQLKLNGLFRAIGYFFGFCGLFMAFIPSMRPDSFKSSDLLWFYGSVAFIILVSAYLRFYMGNSAVSFAQGNLVIKLGSKKVIPFSSITDLAQLTIHSKYAGRGGLNQQTALFVYYDKDGKRKKVEIRTQVFENGEDIKQKIREYTGLEVKKEVKDY